MRAEIPYHIDELSMLNGARIHDAVLEGVAFSVQTLSMDVQRVDGTRICIEADGVKQLNIVELWEAAIISELFVWKLSAPPTYALDLAWSRLFRNRGDWKSAVAGLKAKHPQASLVELTCSYGGSILCVAERLHVYEIT